MLVILATVLALEGAFLAAVRLYYYGTAEKSLAGRVAVSADLAGRYLPSRSMSEKAHAIIRRTSSRTFRTSCGRP